MQSFNENLRDLCIKLFDIGALKFGNFKMKVGVNSPVYFDLRVIVSHPKVLEQLSTLLWQFAEQKEIRPVVLCGVPYTALPIATVISVKTDIPMLIRRKEPKSYGTMKLIEGKFNNGDECLIVEDVVTSGCSILETVNDLNKDGLFVKDALVVIDREQGGAKNLKNNNINMHSLLTLSKALEVLCEAEKVDNATVERVKAYISETQIFPDGRPQSSLPTENRLVMNFLDRSTSAKNEVAKRLFSLMERKRTNLCVAVDVTTSTLLLSLVSAVGDHAAVIKTHYDAVSDWDKTTEESLQALAKKHDFMILEDRKFADIGNTVALQCSNVLRWADIVTLHSVTGCSVIEGARQAAAGYGDRGLFLVAELSSKRNLVSPQYTKSTGELAMSNRDVVVGLVCQNHNILSEPGLIQLTPGVSSQPGEDTLGQQYVGPEEAVLKKGGDLIVVGRAITESSDPEGSAKMMKEKLWESYSQRVCRS